MTKMHDWPARGTKHTAAQQHSSSRVYGTVVLRWYGVWGVSGLCVVRNARDGPHSKTPGFVTPLTTRPDFDLLNGIKCPHLFGDI